MYMGIKLLNILKKEVSEQYWGLAWKDTLSDESKKRSEEVDAKKITKNTLDNVNIDSTFLIEPSTKRNSPFNQVRGTNSNGTPKLHKGIDYGVGVGTLVVLIKPGVVLRSGMNLQPTGYGALIEIEHEDGVITRYGHMSEIYVSDGDKINGGEIIGATGGAEGSVGAGNSQGPHLHFEYRVGGTPIDPASSNNDNSIYRFMSKSDKPKLESSIVDNPVNTNNSNVMSEKQMNLIYDAKKHLGKPYKWGGNGPNSFDCSGFVRYVYDEFGANVKNVPRTADNMYDLSKKIQKSELQPGDLVFFNTKNKNKMDHVGIVISPYGSDKIDFIHAGASDGVAVINDLYSNSFYGKNIGGFGRFDVGLD